MKDFSVRVDGITVWSQQQLDDTVTPYGLKAPEFKPANKSHIEIVLRATIVQMSVVGLLSQAVLSEGVSALLGFNDNPLVENIVHRVKARAEALGIGTLTQRLQDLVLLETLRLIGE